MESDLLRYLTAHISPPCFVDSNAEGSFRGDVTSFVIERGEYLEGIVRLIQSDCPEAVDDMASFVCAIQGAFSKVTGLKALE
jgi:23S rRNA A2030 N6-methylase RlmJ